MPVGPLQWPGVFTSALVPSRLAIITTLNLGGSRSRFERLSLNDSATGRERTKESAAADLSTKEAGN